MQQNLRIVKVAVHLVTFEPGPVVPEHNQHDRYDTTTDEGHTHQPLHEYGYLRGKVEPVDGQPKEWCYR